MLTEEKVYLTRRQLRTLHLGMAVIIIFELIIAGLNFFVYKTEQCSSCDIDNSKSLMPVCYADTTDVSAITFTRFPVDISTCEYVGYVYATVTCNDGNIWRHGPRKDDWKRILNVPQE
jgi:hypothetical protein